MSTSEQNGPEALTPQNRPAKRVSLQTVERLSVYRKVLEELDRDGVENIHSHELAELVGVTPAQLRRDLASFGTFGNISRGYNVYQMSRTISRIMGTDETQDVALFGVGDLGRALLSYRGFEERGFHIAVAFDVDSEKVGRVFAGRRCYHVDQLERGAARVRRQHGDPRVPARRAADAGRPRQRLRRPRGPQLRPQARQGAGRVLRREHRHLVQARDALVPGEQRSRESRMNGARTQAEGLTGVEFFSRRL